MRRTGSMDKVGGRLFDVVLGVLVGTLATLSAVLWSQRRRDAPAPPRDAAPDEERHPGLSALEPDLAAELAAWDALSDEALLNFEESLAHGTG